MSVILGKIVWSLLTPGSLLFTLLLLALVLSWWSVTRRWGIRLGLPVFVLVIGMGFAPTFDWLIRPLEGYYPVPPLPAKVDGIVVLGGSEDPGLTAAHGGQPQLGASAERLIVFADLARRYPDARLIFTGRGAWNERAAFSEADVARGALAMMGLDTGRVQFENESRNTIENAEKSLPLAQPKPGETWLLVTSAIHMPRAVNCFRTVGWPVLPYPVDFIAGEPVTHLPFQPLSALNRLNAAALEWAGLIAYRVLGRTHELLPPRTLATMKQD
jgi:uncharacterized SAM-binding protein YcdF (DUF218 family)